MKSAGPPAAVSSQSAPAATVVDSRAGISRVELAAAIVLAVFAGGLRLAHLDRVAIEHFDEGVYAANFYAAHLEDRFPDRHLYAPPLLPLLIEYSIVYGGGLHAAMWVNLAAGILLTPVLWWVGRSWFGPLAGLSAAALCAFSDVHLLYSRTALTDPLLALMMALAVYMIWRSICQGGIFSSVLCGLLVGAAWWTKYNGWLPLAIAIAGFVAWLLWGVLPQSFADDEPAARINRRKDDGPRLSRNNLVKVLGPRLFIICVVSVACWVPYVWKLQESGGYTAVAANHARYITGLAGWGTSFFAQVRNIYLLEGPVTAAGMLVLAVLLGLMSSGSVRQRVLLVMSLGLAAMALTAWLGSAAVLLVVGAWGLLQLIVTRPNAGSGTATQSEDIRSSESNLAAWMLAAWFIGLLVTTPLYHPYSRLTLPWLTASWLLAGLSLSMSMQRVSRKSTDGNAATSTSAGIWRWPVVAASVAILIWQAPQLAARGVCGWEKRNDMVRASGRFVELAAIHRPEFADNSPEEVDAVFYILAEPAMFVQLSAMQIDSTLNYIAQPASSFAMTTLTSDPGFTVYLIVGPHILRDERELAEIPNITLVGSFAYRPSMLVWLDEYPGRPISEWKSDDPKWELRLYRVMPQ